MEICSKVAFEVILMVNRPKKAISVLVPMDLYCQLKVQAEKTNRTVSGYVRQILRRYLWHVENAPEILTGEWDIT